MKTGIIDVGGGLRGIYGAGVTDKLMELGVEFDCHIGVSAGAANMTSYIAGQRGRNYRFYTDYAFRKEYMGFGNYIRSGEYINLDYIYGALSNQGMEDPLDYEALRNETKSVKDGGKGKELIIVATDAGTGDPVYFTAEDMAQDNYDVVKASCCVPLVNKPYEFRGGKFYDGGISDAVPVEKALESGCEKVVLILTKPRDYYRESKSDERWSFFLESKYPASAKALSRRGDLYNFYLDKAKAYERDGRVLIIAPDDIGKLKTLSKDKASLDTLYNKGFRDAERIPSFIAG